MNLACVTAASPRRKKSIFTVLTIKPLGCKIDDLGGDGSDCTQSRASRQRAPRNSPRKPSLLL